MTNYALIRVSDERKQDSETQLHAIKLYCAKYSIQIHYWYDFQISGSKFNREQRGIAEVLRKLEPGDNLITTDLPRLGRESVSDLMEIALAIINKGATLHFCYSEETLCAKDQNNPTKLFLTLADSFTAWRFAKERSEKARAAISRRKSAGLANGRPKGLLVKSKLDQHEHKIIAMKNEGISEYKISDFFNVHRTTLRSWLKTRENLIQKAQQLGLWELGLSISDIKELLNKEQQDNS
ncbi:recombinase family protein [Pseudoalteromonas galatheae]|uniref:recombinase family protein n=1 Tax=Pseudoalteromonas galatheae TaxID=579562 RepID=UPI0030D15CED